MKIALCLTLLLQSCTGFCVVATALTNGIIGSSEYSPENSSTFRYSNYEVRMYEFDEKRKTGSVSCKTNIRYDCSHRCYATGVEDYNCEF